MNRIYHPHTKWEEVKYNMYGKINPKTKESDINKVVLFFFEREKVEKNMAYVIDNFKYSCEHNFTNPSMNKIAWLGQSAVAVCYNIPNEITMIAWNFLPENIQKRANKIAKNEIERWELCQRNI